MRKGAGEGGGTVGGGGSVRTLALTPLVSLLFAGATLTEHDDLSTGDARIGCPAWGSAELLASLELRLGLPKPPRAEVVRVQQWSRRMAEVEAASPGRFYARSYALDSLGTATTTLAWRDELVTAGWNGEAIPDGGERLETLRTLAAGSDLAPGLAERIRRVEDALHACRVRAFDAILLAEPRALWPGRWQRLFTLLEEIGTSVRTVEATLATVPGDSDLARLQALLGGNAKGPSALRGDGSLIVLRAETSWELGDAIAALLRAWGEPSTVILRGGESRPLDYALVAQGLASQGLDETSVWRPALQLLPLAVELAFEPRDPYRVLELLTLPVGPFQGLVGRELASAMAQSPGIGGPAWRAGKEEIARVTRANASDGEDAEAMVERRLSRIATWLEEPGHSASRPAPRDALLAVADRVRTWLQRRLAMTQKTAESDPVEPGLAARTAILGTAYAQAQAFHEALSHESRAELELVDARLLVEQVSLGHTLTLATEHAGRIDAVDSPAALRCARDVVVWWHCVGGTEWRPPARPWRRQELDALRDAGIVLADRAGYLAADARGWHQVILAARKRLVLAMPRRALGAALDPHPVWHEIAARFGASDADVARVTVDARDLLAGRVTALGRAAAPPVKDLGPLALPQARNEWHLDAKYLTASPRHSATSLETLVACPLRWALKYPAGLREGALGTIPRGPRLNGTLGHRLVEELHRAGVLTKPASLTEAIATTLERLLETEGAVLLRPGMTFELVQLRDQYARAVARLAEILAESRLTLVEAELAVDGAWRAGTLSGRIDLLLRDEAGRDVVLDLKWGNARYRKLLEKGHATQLAVYAAARRTATKASAMPAAAYFSLGQGKILATEGTPFVGFVPIVGPTLSDTWSRLERTVDRVERTLRTGRVPVTGLKRSLPLLEAMGLDAEERKESLELEKEAACDYCPYPALCGKAWENVA
jgi:ATP-dependent helicase/nuclease subunit B